MDKTILIMLSILLILFSFLLLFLFFSIKRGIDSYTYAVDAINHRLILINNEMEEGELNVAKRDLEIYNSLQCDRIRALVRIYVNVTVAVVSLVFYVVIISYINNLVGMI